ncbi:uracil-DNA glycosylase [Microcella putealis]|uniref:Uracil-DNA glycosylase n=1 Tax=Microcella putealis TaxID=337005 RepID=A0A4Q7LXN3_9MICO|nr:uracil-DNA glycosylase [Microcella putealis]RZS59202.1 uracil-DNA glycosylase [Microcella putealis]TQM24228.1 uracil-DNA glycosylase [Microcella putealis]
MTASRLVLPAALAPPTGLGAGWAEALLAQDRELGQALAAIAATLEVESAAGRPWLPEGPRVLRALTRPLAEARVLIVGQDPYPTPGHPVGLAFAAERAVRPLPRSLANIYRELADDLGVTPPAHPDLSPWFERGVVLLNRALTVEAGTSGSHARLGWQRLTDAVVRALAARGGPFVAILWGRDAQAVTPLLGDVPVIASAHPSPLSARRGFFGSRPFSRANAALASRGGEPLDWDIRS